MSRRTPSEALYVSKLSAASTTLGKALLTHFTAGDPDVAAAYADPLDFTDELAFFSANKKPSTSAAAAENNNNNNANEGWASSTTAIHVAFEFASLNEAKRVCAALSDALRAADSEYSLCDVLLHVRCNGSDDTVLEIICRRPDVSAEWFALYFELVDNDRSMVVSTKRPPLAILCATTAQVDLAKRFLVTGDDERAAVARPLTDGKLTSCLYACVNGDTPNVAMLAFLAECDPELKQLAETTDERQFTLLHDACNNQPRCGADVLEFLCHLRPAWVTIENNFNAAPLLNLCHSDENVSADSIRVLGENGGATAKIMATPNRATDWAPLEALVRTLCLLNRKMRDPPFKPQIQYMNDLGFIAPPNKFHKVLPNDEQRAAQYREQLKVHNMQVQAWDADERDRRARRPPFRAECVRALLACCADTQRACTLLVLPGAAKDTILHFACRENLPTLITAVLEDNPSAKKLLKKTNGANELPEAVARKLGAAPCLAALSGMSVDASGNQSELLAEAIHAGNDVVVELVVGQNPELIAADLGKQRGAPLQWAIACNRRFIVELLLGMGDEARALQLLSQSHVSDFRNCVHQAVALLAEEILTVMAKLANLSTLIDDELLRLACRDTTILATLIREIVQEHHKVVVEIRAKAEEGGDAEGDEPRAKPKVPSLASAFKFVESKWDLRGLNLSHVVFPPEVRYLPVTNVDLALNGLVEFPISVLRFRKLVELNLSDNLIGDISSPKIISALRSASVERSIAISMRRNRLVAVPPELYSLKNVQADMAQNPLRTSLVLPVWLFGLASYDRLMLATIDVTLLGLCAIVVMTGVLFVNNPNLAYAIFAELTFLFALLFVGSFAFGLGKMLWSDAAFSPLACCNGEALRRVADSEVDDWVDQQDAAEEDADAEGETDGDQEEEGKGDDEKEDEKKKKKKKKKNRKEKEEKNGKKEEKDDDDDDGGDQFDGLSSSQMSGAQDQAISIAVDKLHEFAERDKSTGGGFCSTANALSLLNLVLELPTLLSVSFSANNPWPPQIVETFVWFQLNIKAIEAALGNPGFDIVSFHITFWLSVLLVILQRLLLELARYQRISGPAASFLQSSLSLTALPVFTNLAKPLSCTYSPTGGEALLDGLTTTVVVCWSDTQHIVLASVGLVAMLVYFPMATLTVPIWQSRADKLTIKFPSYFLIVGNLLKMFLALLVAFFSTAVNAYLALNLAATLLLLLMVVQLRSPYLIPGNENYLVMWRVKLGRTGTYIGASIGAIASIATAVVNAENFSVGSFFVMLAVNAIVGAIAGVFIKRGPAALRGVPDAAMVENGVRDDNDVELRATSAAPSEHAPKKSKPKHEVCEICGVRPVQAVIKKDDVETDVCRRCIKQRAHTLNATPSEYNLISKGLSDRNDFYTVRGGAGTTMRKATVRAGQAEDMEKKEAATAAAAAEAADVEEEGAAPAPPDDEKDKTD